MIPAGRAAHAIFDGLLFCSAVGIAFGLQDARHVLDKDRVGQLGRSRHAHNGGAERTQQMLVGRKLRRGPRKTNRLTRKMCQLALRAATG